LFKIFLIAAKCIQETKERQKIKHFRRNASKTATYARSFVPAPKMSKGSLAFAQVGG
jgi:hypothetical protein